MFTECFTGNKCFRSLSGDITLWYGKSHHFILHLHSWLRASLLNHISIVMHPVPEYVEMFHIALLIVAQSNWAYPRVVWVKHSGQSAGLLFTHSHPLVAIFSSIYLALTCSIFPSFSHFLSLLPLTFLFFHLLTFHLSSFSLFIVCPFSLRWRMIGSMLPWWLTASSFGSLCWCVCWELWASSCNLWLASSHN